MKIVNQHFDRITCRPKHTRPIKPEPKSQMLLAIGACNADENSSLEPTKRPFSAKSDPEP
jgi:hypothetical protein